MNDQNEGTILVSGLPDSATSKRVTMHFQKRKNGGGDVKEVKMLGQGNAKVTFEDRTVAKRILEVEQIFEATTLNVQLEENELFQNVEIGKRKVLVSGLPEDITENAVKIHFQKKRNGGGDIEKVNLLKDGFAEIVFEKAEVASQVAHTPQIMKGITLTAELMKNETFQKEKNDAYEETSDKISRSVVVSSLPDRVKENKLHIYFQKKKNGGGDISEVHIFPDKNQALVVFHDIQVAKRVVKTEQRICGKILKLELQSDFLSKTNAETSEENVGKKVLVSCLPEDVTKNAVKIHFQKKKNGGGDIKEVNLLKNGFAEIIFEKSEVANQVVDTQQIMKGKTLNVELMENETFEREENDVYEETSDKNSRSVVVSSLPDGLKEHELHIHFQKQKNGGGDVSEVHIIPDKNQAFVVFDDIQVARRVVKTEQRIHGNILNLQLQNDFSSKTNEITTKERTIIISDLPNDFTENDVKFHFEKKQHVDEDLGRKVKVLFIGRTALVLFGNGEDAKKAAETPQIVRGETLNVNLFKEQSLADEMIKKYDQSSHETMTSTHSIEKETKSEISYDSSGDHLNNEKDSENLNGAKYWKSGVVNDINPVFSEVCATIYPDLLHTASEEYWREVFDVIQKSSSITWSHGVFGVYLKGSLDDVVKAGELLLLHWQKKFENVTSDNTDLPQETVVSVGNKSQGNQNELQTRSNFSLHQKELKDEKEVPQQQQSVPGTYSKISTFHHLQRVPYSKNPFFLDMSGSQNFPPIVTNNKLVSTDKKNEALNSKVDEDNKNTGGSHDETEYEEGSRKISNASIANTEDHLSNYTKHSESSNTSSNHTKQSKSFGIPSNISSAVQVDAKPETDCVEENSTPSSESESNFRSDPSSIDEVPLKSQKKEIFISCKSPQDSMQNSNNSSNEHASSLSPETYVVAADNRKVAATFSHPKNTQ